MLIDRLGPEAAPHGDRPEPTERTDPPADSGAARPLNPPDWSDGRAGRLVERWLPGGPRAVDGVWSRISRHRLAAAVVVLLAAIGTAAVLLTQRPTPEPAPALPAAINEVAATGTPSDQSTSDSRIVISVVGKVVSPGLVTLPNGARVADAVAAAGGVPPGTDLITLNLARRLSDGEQIYVGIPVPAGASTDPPSAGNTDGSSSATGGQGGKGKKAAALHGRVNLNTASLDELETLPGVGPATAQRIVNWRGQHGSFTSVEELRQVGGIGQAKFAKLQDLVTT